MTPEVNIDTILGTGNYNIMHFNITNFVISETFYFSLDKSGSRLVLSTGV